VRRRSMLTDVVGYRAVRILSAAILHRWWTVITRPMLASVRKWLV
jgi:hypothetical protein